MTIEDNTALVRRLFEALNAGMEATNALRPDAFALHETFCVAGHSLDYAAHAQFDAMLFTAFPDIQFRLEDLLADRDKVIARLTARGTQTGVFQGIPATGSAAAVSGIAIYRMVGGKVVSSGSDMTSWACCSNSVSSPRWGSEQSALKHGRLFASSTRSHLWHRQQR